MKTQKHIAMAGILAVFAITFATLSLTGCPNEPGNPTDIIYVATQTGGTDNTADSTGIVFTFSASVSGLTAENITVADGTGSVTKGVLSGSGTSWSLAVTVITAGNVTVSINKAGIDPSTKDIPVYKAGQPDSDPTAVTYTVAQTGGTDFTANSTGIVFTFSESVDSLTAADIIMSGNAAKDDSATLSGTGTTRTLSPITVSAAGLATVQITKTGIEAGTKHVTVYRIGQSAPTLDSITAQYSPGAAVIYLSTPLDSLKHYLTVKAAYSDNSEYPLSGSEYTISGTLAIGTSTITVTYEGKTTTFDITINAVTYTAAQTGGVNGTADSTGIVFTFSAPIDDLGLTAANISVGGNAAKGSTAALTGSGVSWTLSPITVSAAGTATVTITKTGIEAGTNDVSVHKAAQTTPGTPGLQYTLINNDTAYSVTNYTGTSSAVIIPAAYEGKPVTGIGGAAFDSCTSLVSITIPANVTFIEWATFRNCTSLTSIEIPASVTSFGWAAFEGCTSLTTVTFASGSRLESINGAFRDCASLTSITIPAGVTSMWGTFNGCTNLESVIFASGSGLQVIGDGAFENCTRLASIIIPANVTLIAGWGTFNGCTSLTTVTFASGSRLETIGAAAFWNCTNLTSINIPASVTSIDMIAFNGCERLPSINIPANVTSIGGNAFGGCIGLTAITVNGSNLYFSSEGGILYNKTKTEIIAYPSASGTVTIPEGVTSIGGFSKNLAGIIIPASVTNVDGFGYCTSLTTFTVNEGNPHYMAEGAILYNKNKTELVAYPSASGTVTIPASVTSIGGSAFCGCTGLTSITLPANLTSIGGNAFEVTGLTSITIPANVTFIGGWSFQGCPSLTSITLPANLTSIGDGMFNDCPSLASINIPANVTSIGSYAFQGCTSITSIFIPAGVTSVGESLFQGWGAHQTINIQGSTSGWDQGWWNNCNAQINY